jgi:type II secretory pathway pseudopilin PulG
MKITKEAGFGLIETLIAASILAMVAGGSIALVNSSLKRSVDSLDRVVATNLSREAIELLRSARDSTYIDKVFDSSGNPNKWYDPINPIGGPYELGSTQINSVKYPRLKPTVDGELIELDNVEYRRKIFVEAMDFNYPSVVGLPEAAQINQDEIIRLVKVEITWGSSERQKLETTVVFTDWRFGT